MMRPDADNVEGGTVEEWCNLEQQNNRVHTTTTSLAELFLHQPLEFSPVFRATSHRGGISGLSLLWR